MDTATITPTVLDATCGGRMMWWNKAHDDVLYLDRRVVPPGSIVQQPMWNVTPDVVADFTALPYADGAFEMVVYDPPHAPIAEGGIIASKFGTLTDLDEIVAGLHECLRVSRGWVVFKWAEAPFPVGDVVDRLGVDPMFGHRTAKSGATIWCVFDAR